MGYKATVKDYDLRITKKNDLIAFLHEISSKIEPCKITFANLDSALKNFLNADISITPEGRFNKLQINSQNYHDEDWKSIASFLSGYIEWIGEDDVVWRDNFRQGAFVSESPEVIWPSEWMYVEKWCDEDISSQIRGYNILDDDPIFNTILDEAKIRVQRCFDDKSYRNEQIENVISDILYERSRKNEENI